MKVKINDLFWYGQWYMGEEEDIKPLWYINIMDYSVVSYKDNADEINADEEHEIYIPLFCTSAVAAEKEYIESLNNKKLSKYFSEIKSNFDTEYKTYFECYRNGYAYSEWWELYKKKLISDAVQWCKANNLPYVL